MGERRGKEIEKWRDRKREIRERRGKEIEREGERERKREG